MSVLFSRAMWAPGQCLPLQVVLITSHFTGSGHLSHFDMSQAFHRLTVRISLVIHQCSLGQFPYCGFPLDPRKANSEASDGWMDGSQLDSCCLISY